MKIYIWSLFQRQIVRSDIEVFLKMLNFVLRNIIIQVCLAITLNWRFSLCRSLIYKVFEYVSVSSVNSSMFSNVGQHKKVIKPSSTIYVHKGRITEKNHLNLIRCIPIFYSPIKYKPILYNLSFGSRRERERENGHLK